MPDARSAEAREARGFLADRLRMILTDSPVTVSITLINAFILAFVHRGLVRGEILVLWFAYMALAMAGRLLLLYFIRRNALQSGREAARWERLLRIQLMASGAGWGGGGVVLISQAPASHQIFTAFVLGGMAAAALPTLSRIFRAYLLFIVPALTPAIAYFAFLGTEVALSMAGMGVLFLAFLLFTGRRHEATVLGALRLADQNRSLVEHLSKERERALEDKERVDRLNENLRREIAERHRTEEALLMAKTAAEAASEAKSQFLANMSHELRTPLNAIIGYSEILREDALERGREEGVADLVRINTAGRHLLTLINEVLDLARIEAGRTELHIEKFDVDVVLTDAVDAVEPLIMANGNRLVVDRAPDVRDMTGDATKLRQILSNLLSNAAKFTENGEIRLDVTRYRDGGASPDRARDWVLFRVTDTGIGIPPDRIGMVFEAFERSEAGRDPRYGGTGLGLAICRHYCELMDGAISVESEAGKGTEFLVRLPLSLSAGPRAAGPAP